MLHHVLKLIDFQSMFHYLVMSFFTLRILDLRWLSKQTAIVVSLETPFSNWIDEGMLDEYNTNLLRY